MCSSWNSAKKLGAHISGHKPASACSNYSKKVTLQHPSSRKPRIINSDLSCNSTSSPGPTVSSIIETPEKLHTGTFLCQLEHNHCRADIISFCFYSILHQKVLIFQANLNAHIYKGTFNVKNWLLMTLHLISTYKRKRCTAGKREKLNSICDQQ